MNESEPAEQAARKFLLESFNDFLMLEQGASPRTDEAYGRDLTRFATYALSRGAGGPPDITARLLREYVYHLKDLGLAPASIRRNGSAVRTYFRFLTGERRSVDAESLPNRQWCRRGVPHRFVVKAGRGGPF